jgi:hypothetical protein
MPIHWYADAFVWSQYLSDARLFIGGSRGSWGSWGLGGLSNWIHNKENRGAAICHGPVRNVFVGMPFVTVLSVIMSLWGCHAPPSIQQQCRTFAFLEHGHCIGNSAGSWLSHSAILAFMTIITST